MNLDARINLFDNKDQQEVVNSYSHISDLFPWDVPPLKKDNFRLMPDKACDVVKLFLQQSQNQSQSSQILLTPKLENGGDNSLHQSGKRILEIV